MVHVVRVEGTPIRSDDPPTAVLFLHVEEARRLQPIMRLGSSSRSVCSESCTCRCDEQQHHHDRGHTSLLRHRVAPSCCDEDGETTRPRVASVDLRDYDAGGPSRMRGTYSRSCDRPSNVRLCTRSSPTSG